MHEAALCRRRGRAPEARVRIENRQQREAIPATRAAATTRHASSAGSAKGLPPES
jgi:hypothetical protein